MNSKIFTFSILAVVLLTMPVSGIETTQNSNVLTINAEIDLNISIEIYNSHQVLAFSQYDFSVYPSSNYSLPEDIAYTGGYYRIAYVNDSISSTSFIEIVPWLTENQVNDPVVNETVSENNDTQSFDLVLVDEDNQINDLTLLGGASAFALTRRKKT